MTDYIKREDAIKIINSGISVDTDADKRYVNGLFMAIRPADVAPVRHGRWEEKQPIEYYHMMECIAVRYNYACSECGFIEPRRYNYCPYCGARMDEETEE